MESAMTKAVLTAAENSAYEDLKEHWYHFPNTYLRQVMEAEGDEVVFYEPRRSSGLDHSGSQSYFATAQIVRVRPDPNRADHHFADLAGYLAFDEKVPFKVNGSYWESLLKKEDGSTNKGAFGRSVRLIPDEEFSAIIAAGLGPSFEEARLEADEESLDLLLPAPPLTERPTATTTVTRKIRDVAFRRHVRIAYANTCAITGLRFSDKKGRPEVQGAHILPVEANGPDSVCNGIAMTATVHWLFDRGLISIGDDYRVLRSAKHHDALAELPLRDLMTVPEKISDRPHPTYLEWHRANRFGGS
jgi:putative restriction endonuclease